ncbi:Adenosylmethionine-8-amino-7-oxononanoate aminotransferase [Candidatus Magnetomoraceae bacterium gMMP-1]
MIENKERNKQLEEDSKKYIWYPFTQMRDFINEEPVIIEKAEGCILKDIYGNEYIDGISSLWTNVHGHKKEEIDNAIIKQIENIAHSTLLGLSNVPAVNLAKKLINIAPKGLTRVFYSDSGSSAVEIALKMAFQYQQQKGNPKKKKFISMKNAYHGDTIGSVSLGGIDLFHEVYGPLLFDSFKAESPYCYRCPFEKSQSSCDLKCLKQMESIMEEHADEVTALIIEPLVQGAAGILVHPDNYLKELRKLCTKYNILMIADEVAVGFGKTGSMFACEKEGVVPDIMALAKGISGGYLPLAATLTSEEIFQGFLGKYEDFKTFFHGHTYTGNPVACAAALANLEIFEQEQVIDKLQVKINHFSKRLEEFKSLLHVGDVRRQGIMVGIELVLNKESKSVYLPEDKIGQKVIAEARKHGLIIRPLGNVIVLMPPLSISIEELDRLCDITYEAIKFITE